MRSLKDPNQLHYPIHSIMNISEITANDHSYWKDIWKNVANRKFLLGGLGLSIASFIIFKILYPYPDFFSDSYSYIFAASAHLDINIWPIGYSKFLALFHSITHGDTSLVGFQYFFMQIAALHFFFTIVHLFNPSQWAKAVLFTFLFINPLTLYLCNTINSDAIFCALSLLWLTEIIWIIHRPKSYQLITQAILIFLCFTIRNNAYYYPIITCLAFILSRQSVWKKLSGIAITFILIISFIITTQNAAYKLTGVRTFSLFTGWQIANNALYMYDASYIDSTAFTSPATKELNRLTLNFLSRINPETYHPYLDDYVGNFFIRQPESPLKQYYSLHYRSKDDLESIINWARASKVFETFGKSIVYKHPFRYIQYFSIPNIYRYFVPPLSHLERYNYGTNKIDPIAQQWFDYPHLTITVFSHGFQGIILLIYPAFFLLMNLYCIWNCIQFYLRKGFFLVSPVHSTIYKILLSFFILNFIFTSISTVNILRYQFVPMICTLGFSLLLADVVESQSELKKQNKVSKRIKITATEY